MRSFATLPARPGGTPGRRAALALALLAVLPYLNGLFADFTFDDKVVVRDNARLASPSRAGELFTTSYFGGELSASRNYRPVVLLTYAVQRWSTGADPLPFHVVNVALHAATTLLLAAWLLALGMPRGPSLAASALFAVVPIHVEAVTGVVGRAELLVALLVFLSSLLFLRATEGERLRAAPYAGAVAAFLVALFVKEHAVVLPGVVVLGELLRLDAGPLAARLRRKALPFLGLLAPLAALAAFRLVVLGGLATRKEAFFELDNPLAPMPALLRAANGLWLLLRYAAQTFVPLGLSADHSAHALDVASSLGDPRCAGALAALLLAAIAALAAARRVPLFTLGAAFFLGTFVPTSNVLFPIGTIYADRLAYLPSAGLLAAAAGLVAALPATSRAFRAALLGVALATCAGATAARNEVFRDDDRLFADMLEKVPRSARARYNAAYRAWSRRETVVARSSLEKAVALFPRYYDAWNLLGVVAAKEGRTAEALADCREALRVKPDYEISWVSLARIEQEAGLLEEAERTVRDGLSRFPRSAGLLSRNASLLAARGRLEEARRAWALTLEVPGGTTTEARLGLARALSGLGREREALSEARRAIAAAPGSIDARLFLAGRYEAAGKALPAAAELGRAVRSAPREVKPARLLMELACRETMARGVASTALPGIEETFGRPPRNIALRAAVDAFRSGAGAAAQGARGDPPRGSPGPTPTPRSREG